MGRLLGAVLLVSAALLTVAYGLARGAAPKGSVSAVLGIGLAGGDSGVLLGGTIGGKWAGPEQVARGVHGGESYRLYGRNNSREAGRGSAPRRGDDPPAEGVYLVALPPGPRFKEPSVAISGSWDARPRPVDVEYPYQQAWQDAVRAVLVKEGIARPVLEITSATAGDLDGDGVREVVLTARHGSLDANDTWEDPRRGDYSLVMLYRPAPRGPQSVVLEVTCPERSKSGLDGRGMRWFRPPLLLDLGGDGTMEVVVPFLYYEGMGMDAYAVKGATAKRLFEVMVGG